MRSHTTIERSCPQMKWNQVAQCDERVPSPPRILCGEQMPVQDTSNPSTDPLGIQQV